MPGSSSLPPLGHEPAGSSSSKKGAQPGTKNTSGVDGRRRAPAPRAAGRGGASRRLHGRQAAGVSGATSSSSSLASVGTRAGLVSPGGDRKEGTMRSKNFG